VRSAADLVAPLAPDTGRHGARRWTVDVNRRFTRPAGSDPRRDDAFRNMEPRRTKTSTVPALSGVPGGPGRMSRMTPAFDRCPGRHCERSEAIQCLRGVGNIDRSARSPLPLGPPDRRVGLRFTQRLGIGSAGTGSPRRLPAPHDDVRVGAGTSLPARDLRWPPRLRTAGWPSRTDRRNRHPL
jgi:hypothetical protein